MKTLMNLTLAATSNYSEEAGQRNAAGALAYQTRALDSVQHPSRRWRRCRAGAEYHALGRAMNVRRPRWPSRRSPSNRSACDAEA